MLESIVGRYIHKLEAEMQKVVADHLLDEPGFGVMVRYAMGWVDKDDHPYTQMTGKRLRPTLMFLSAESAGGNWELAVPAAVAVELLHNFSLIHDDIQDVSEFRHGRPTVWKVWGTANAINAGDAVFTLSYAALAGLADYVSPEQMILFWRVFNRTNIQLTRGQHLDMYFETLPLVSVADYLSMILGKSAALISTSAYMGSLVATGSEEIAQLYADFGLNLGLAFQIHDDILGIWGDPSVTGKSAATDIISRKKSLPVLYVLAQSDELRSIYAHPELTEQDVKRAVELLGIHGAREFASEQEAKYYDLALSSLDNGLPVSGSRQLLLDFVRFLFAREY